MSSYISIVCAPFQDSTIVSKKILFKKNHFEYTAWAENSTVCGIDEVGRGSLSGPVVAAAVILPSGCSYRLLKDSKILSAQERERAYAWIIKNCSYGLGIIHHRLVDQHNIWQATLLAMNKAYMHLMAATTQRPACILVDAMPLIIKSTMHSQTPVHHFPFGESISTSIAAASIVAKVTRDRIMVDMDKAFPHFMWYSNKGYSSQQHIDALKKYDPTVVHRITYLQKILGEHNDESSMQQTIC